MSKIDKIKRNVHYYELSFTLNGLYILEGSKYQTFIQALLSKITVLVVNSVDSDPVVPGDVDPTLFVGEEQ